jgi:hypothetical protein
VHWQSLLTCVTTQGLPPAALASLKETAEALHELVVQLMQVRTWQLEEQYS